MARRTLKDIEDKILNETVRMGANRGLENISTLELAKLCGISEPTIFVHFKTKRNLIVQAGRRLDGVIKAYIFETEYNFDNKELFNEQIKSTWLKCFHYLLEHPDDAKYYNRYRHSAFFEATLDYSDNGIYRYAVNIILKHNDKLRAYSDIGYPAVLISTIDSTLNYAVTIIEGNLNNDPKTHELIFKLIFDIFL